MSTAIFSQTELNELSVSGLRRAGEVVVSAWLHNPSAGPPFQIADLLGDELPQRALMAPVRRALDQLPAGVQTGLWGVSLPSEPGHPPAGFTVSVTLAEMVDAMATGSRELSSCDAEVTGFILAGEVGFRRAEVTGGQSPDGGAIPLLTLTYVAQTAHGILTVAFGTAHLDAGDIFIALFDRIADSVRVVSAELLAGG